MPLTVRTLVAALLALAFSMPANAEDQTLPAGKTSHILYWYTYNDLCNYGSMPKFKITRQPEHGTVSAKWQATKMGTEARHCEGKYMKGMLVSYTPNKGYRGTDVVKFALIGSGLGPGTAYNLGRSFRYDLTIK